MYVSLETASRHFRNMLDMPSFVTQSKSELALDYGILVRNPMNYDEV